ncbi:sugar phosphate isomerase/epimerase family protein [Alishewanella tabrizica]|uniref:Sugar phosphate isomerase n=1 Tax=Alishewanella tabrizica TaxID=671278 RepID=A0ABQ2WIT9_9ALTE|nr:sugar phosphate isomerase/epimerase [Alishewanella tabrizica]GGW55465.1 sugar phosphate isomerase [Alishewanella tabrizica]
MAFQSPILAPSAAKTLPRRQFMKLILGTSVLMGTGIFQQLAFANTRANIGIQLYTVRDLMQQDVPTTLQLLASLGYQEVEFAGLYEHSAAQVARWLTEFGLTAPAGHAMLKPLTEDTTRVLDEALALGHRYVVMPYLFDHERSEGLRSYQQLAEQLNKVGERCQAVGLQLAYHNHDFEFVQMAQSSPYEVLLTQTDANLVKMEMDLYWAAKMQVDVPALFKRYPGRFPLWHMKDMATDGSFADLGQGIIDFAPAVASAEIAGLQHAFVERDVTADLSRTLQQGVTGFKHIFA